MKKVATVIAWMFALLAAIVLYNVVRHIVFWPPSENVTFRSGDIVMSGRLVKPDQEGRFPAVVILHGSGPETYNDPSYRSTATTLRRNGFAVLLYDKRGAGASGGDFDSANYGDFIDDAVAAVEYLRSRDDIDTERIGLFGNSESGWFTPEIAYRAGKLAFIFNRAGAPLPWIDTVLWEVRNEFLDAGVAEIDLDRLLEMTERRWRYYQAAGFDPGLAESPERDAINAEMNMLRDSIPMATEVLPEQVLPYDLEYYSGFAADSSYDPGPYLMAIDVPMYYAFGETDVNVPTARCVEVIERLREEHDKNISYAVFENVGHPLANWTGILTAGYVPGYLHVVSTWPREQVQ